MKLIRKIKRALGSLIFVAAILTFCYLNRDTVSSAVKDLVGKAGGSFSVTPSSDEPTSDILEHLALTPATVVRVVDGDTIIVKLNGTETRVRLIGVNTPESVASEEYLTRTNQQNTDAGKTASEWLKNYLPKGTKVYLEEDVQQTDTYGRLLAYVWMSDDIPERPTIQIIKTKMLNGILLENGNAQIATYPPNVKYVDYFKQLNKY